jgi:endonuclease/exonuclease/phosphatase family metal-dependent hydrolase
LPVSAQSKCAYDPSVAVYAPHVNVIVNGRNINIWSAHLHVSSASARLTEVKALQACARGWAEARIITGDFNMQKGSTEYLAATVGYTDAWLVAKAAGTATNFYSNCDGCTRNSRIDYVFTSTGATALVLKSSQIFDTRDAYGVTPSDHKPMLVTYEVK